VCGLVGGCECMVGGGGLVGLRGVNGKEWGGGGRGGFGWGYYGGE
jgi:hypothetical protein